MLQSQVNTDLAAAVPGQKATPDQSIYTPNNFVAGQNGTQVGTFCWIDGSNPGAVDGTTSGADAPLGFVERVISTYMYDVTESGTLTVPAGQAVTVAVRGDYWVQTTESATVGGQVYVDKTNGNILSAVGSNGIACPGWVFRTAGDADDMVIISNWGVAPAAAAAATGAVDLSNVTGTLAIANGGTGATSAEAAFTALGGGDIGKLSTVDLTSNVSGVLPVANGGTGADNATTAKSNLEIS